ncbi:hypothetical protein MLD38_024278 [Melastoma candidum]|uniref:Uncharacterized protein n=1 Tax=Melastoma candidum TaxID=119954 RepID=A0ACB9NTC3_9MYRT|nr:hypothetical protein MLD38_024278 [Melastoma candidum]
MATHLQKYARGIPVISAASMNENSTNWIVASQNGCRRPDYFHYQLENMPNGSKTCNLLAKSAGRAERKADVLAGVREHVRLSPKITEAVKGKLSLGARILQVGDMEKVFKLLFETSKKERLIKASQCYLSTTAGPIAGLLFISTEQVAFCSERSMKLCCPTGESLKSSIRLQSHFQE